MRQVVSGLESYYLTARNILGLGRCNIAHSIACTCNIVPRVQDIMTIHDEWLQNELFRKKKSWCYMTPFGEEICRIFVPWNCPFRKGYSSHSKSVITSSNCCAAEFRVRISRLWAPRKRLSPRTNIRAYFSASFKCFSWHALLWKLGNIRPAILLGQSDASENTWWIIRTYHTLTHSITWLCKAVHTQKMH